ncbi:MAG: NAD(P)H-hydrate dehydratase [Candidatus Thorarchaeota archaeon]
MQEAPLSTQDMRVLELNAEYLGVSLGTLMENAGREVSRTIISHHDIHNKRIGIVCGTGGNGGDGFVAARHLQEAGGRIEVFLVGDAERISTPHTLKNWTILNDLQTIPVTIIGTESDVKNAGFTSFDILIDALLGFGLTSNVREPIASAIKAINKAGALKYSIDIPSGMDSDTGKVLGTAVKADHTITMHAPKPGLLLNTECVGALHVVAIGIPDEAYHVCGQGDLWLFNRPRKVDSHKGDFGRVLVIGGSDIYSGAPALAGMAALRTGADLVSIIAPESVAPAIRCYSPNLMVRSTGTKVFDDSCIASVLQAAALNDVIAIGPGLGTSEDSRVFFREVIERLVTLKKLLVIDADGLRALSETEQVFDHERTILTPHWGEMQVLIGRKQSNTMDLDHRLAVARETASRYGATILLKGPIDVITSPDGRHKFNRTGHPAMTVGGTGDVLTGISAALLARNFGAYYAASAGAFVSGIAGELAAKELGGRILATDCISQIPYAMM